MSLKVRFSDSLHEKRMGACSMIFKKNKVVAGDYVGDKVSPPSFLGSKHPTISTSGGQVELNSSTVAGYEVITDDHRKSAISGALRGFIGNHLLGNTGMLAGAMSAKNKSVYTIAVDFVSGKRSLLEVDEKIYRALIKSCF